MSASIRIPYPSATVGTIVLASSIKTILKGSDTTIVISFSDATLMTCTTTSDTSTNTLAAFNTALETARSFKSNGPASSTPVTMPTGKVVSRVAIALQS